MQSANTTHSIFLKVFWRFEKPSKPSCKMLQNTHSDIKKYTPHLS